MDYCPPNSTLSDIVQGKVTSCFINTVTDPLLLVVSLVAGLHQYRLYSHFSTPFDPQLIQKSVLYNIQLVLHFVLPMCSIGRFVLVSVGYGEPVAGVGILNLITSTLPWISTGVLLQLERGHQLPVSARHGHGPVLLIYWTLAFMQVNLRLASLTHEEWWGGLDHWICILDVTLYSLSYVLTCCIFLLGLQAPGLRPLHNYSNLGAMSNTESGSTWRGFWVKICKLLPYMWPKNSRSLQLRVVFCVILLIGVRVTNLFVPIYNKIIIDRLADPGLNTSNWPWREITIWVGLKLLQGGGTGGQGLLNNWRSLLWIKVQQFTSLEIQTSLLAHVHDLSLRWHLGRKTGEVLRIMDRGTSSVNSLLQYLVFNILPTLLDIGIAVIYLGVKFDLYFGLIVFVTMAVYLSLTIIITEWRTKFRRKMNEFDNKQRARGVDSLLNAETVKYFSMEQWEVNKYREAIEQYQSMEWETLASLQLLNLMQSLVINSGMYGVSMYCAYLVAKHVYTVGDYALIGTYLLQLMVPLNFLGTVYRAIQESFINMENMFALMDEKVEIVDLPNAVVYQQNVGQPPEVEFRAVDFHFVPSKPVLSDISFTMPPGSVTALVGTTGGGKSTLAKLLFRLFDVEGGAILVNQQNIKTYTQHSYRSAIGVVPQDTVLFNDTIRYNLCYGRMDATTEELVAAAKMADIHDTVLGFPDGYETVVGERGLKLSGGEKQRVSIARTLLKNPSMIIFDEATSSLDTETERNIQTAIDSAARQRTSLIIAHRLSTIKGSDQILVLDQGRICERGTHAQLLQMEGKYAALWNAQNNAPAVESSPAAVTAATDVGHPAEPHEQQPKRGPVTGVS